MISTLLSALLILSANVSFIMLKFPFLIGSWKGDSSVFPPITDEFSLSVQAPHYLGKKEARKNYKLCCRLDIL
jgi:hypothetical protein